MVAFLLVSSGCDDKRRHAATEGVRFTEVKSPVAADASPTEVTRAWLEALADAQRVRAGGLGSREAKRKYDEAMARIRSLCAEDVVYERVRSSQSVTVPKDVSQDAAVVMTIESWVSMLAHYLDGIEWDSIDTVNPDPQQYATVFLRAANPKEREIVTGLPGSDNPTEGAPSKRTREQALQAGVNPEYVAGIEVRLKEVAEGWRVLSASIGRPRTRLVVGESLDSAPPRGHPPLPPEPNPEQ